jgi:apolipoprotein N-acyltransferase
LEGTGILSLLSVLLLSLSFSPSSFYPLGFIALCPLFLECWLLREEDATHKQFIKKGFLFGTLFMGFMHVWFLELHVWSNWASIIILWTSYSLLLGLYYAGLFYTLSLFRSRFWTYPFIWVLWEWLRSLSSIGNPTGTLGYSQARHLLFIQQASFGGIFWISFLCCLINLLIFICFKNFFLKKNSILPIITLVCISLFSILFGLMHLNSENTHTNTLRIGFLQANHKQVDKLNRKKAPSLRSDYLKYSKTIIKKENPDLLIWPETITTQYNLEKAGFINLTTFIAKHYDTAFLFGTPTYENKAYYNSMALVTKEGIQAPIYHKQKLMPFGEYWPLKGLFKALNFDNIIPKNEYTPGSAHTIPLGDINIGAGVCLESLYPWYFREATQNHADFLTVIANNAWFLNSSGASKHFHMSIFRAIENNRYLIQSANTGISAIISNKGELKSETTLNERTYAVADIPLNLPLSLYTRLGDWIIGISILMLLAQFTYISLKKL